MRRTEPMICLLCLALALAGCGLQAWSAGGTSGVPPTRLQAVLHVADVASGGSSVKLAFSLTNRSDETLYVLTWYTPLEGILGEIFDVRRNGEPLQYQGPLVSRTVPTADNYVRLEPGKSATASVDLAEAYDLAQPGEYTVSFRSPRISHVAKSEDELAVSMDDLGPVAVTSNEVAFDVQEGTDA